MTDIMHKLMKDGEQTYRKGVFDGKEICIRHGLKDGKHYFDLVGNNGDIERPASEDEIRSTGINPVK